MKKLFQNIFKPISNKNKGEISSVFVCYSVKTFKEFLINFFIKKNSYEKILGTIRFNFACHNKFPEISTNKIEELEYISFHLIIDQ